VTRIQLTVLLVASIVLGACQEAALPSASGGDDSLPPDTVGWVQVGRSLDVERPSSERPAAPPVAAKAASGEAAALARVQEAFPEFFQADAAPTADVPVNPEAALHVTPPASEGEALELTTRGYTFQVRAPRTSGGATKRVLGDVAWYGPGHLWAPVGRVAEAREGRWGTHRVEEYFVLPEGQRQHHARYEVTVPEGIESVRDAHDYLEFLDAEGRAVLRMHHVVARDSQGRTRQGPAQLRGVVAVAAGGGQLARYALTGRTLSVRMVLDLEGLTGPVVVDPGWSSTGTIANGRSDFTMTLLPSGKVLFAGGRNAQYITVASADLYDPVWGGWSSAGAMHVPRDSHTATLLLSGKVLVAGLRTNTDVYDAGAREDLYDPTTGTWSTTGAMSSPRGYHTATLLPDGRVLVAGGSASAAQSTAELYDPTTGAWSPTGSMMVRHQQHVAVLLPNGTVLVAGGYSSSVTVTNAAEVFDPATGSWTATGSMLSPRRVFSGTLLPNGKVLVAGGFGPQTNGGLHYPYASAELYDPATGTWAQTGAMTSPRAQGATLLLSNGKVLMASGYGASNLPTATSELYDFASGTWTASSQMVKSRQLAIGTMLPDGRALVGDLNSNIGEMEIYEPGTAVLEFAGGLGTARTGATATLFPNGNVLSMGGRTASGEHAYAEEFKSFTGGSGYGPPGTPLRSGHTATLLLDGRVLMAGGALSNGTVLASAERFKTSIERNSTGAMAVARTRHAATRLPDGRVLVSGGVDGSGSPLASAELYDPATGTWSATGTLGAARDGHLSLLLSTGKVLVVGGSQGSLVLASAELYDPNTGTWSATGGLATARMGHAGTVLTDGQVLVVGGRNGAGAFLASAERYAPHAGTWSAAGSLPVARDQTTATLLLSGQVLVAGGRQDAAGTPRASLELYSPKTNTWTTSPAVLTTARYGHTAVLLPTGKVAVMGGTTTDGTPTRWIEFFIPDGARDAWRTSVSLPALIEGGAAFTATGTRFRGISQGSQGRWSTSPVDVPIAQLMPVGGGALTPLPMTRFSSTSLDTVAPLLPAGYYLLSVSVGGVMGGRVVGIGNGTVKAQAQSLSTAEDTPVPLTLAATSTEGRPFTWSVLMPPARGTLSGTAPHLTYTPSPDFFGNDAFVFEASDGVSSGVATVSLTVTPVGDAPVASAVSATTVSAAAVPVKLLATDVDGDALAYQVKAGPAHGTLSGTAPNLTYTSQAGYVGTDSFTYTASDGTFESNVATVTLTINAAPVHAMAVYDSTLKVPRCAGAVSSCDSGALLNGRGPLGPEPNQPNTLGGTCADGASGYYHNDESLDRLKVSTLDGTPLNPGKPVKVEATGWAYTGSGQDTLLLYYSPSVTHPSWVLLSVMSPTFVSTFKHTVNFTLPAEAGTHVIRGIVTYGSSGGPCFPGNFNDHDDLVFNVGPPPDTTPPSAALTSPLPGEVLSGFASITATATDAVGVTKVELYDGTERLGTDTAAPYAFSWNTRMTTNGPHTLSIRAYDAAGNVGVAEVLVTIDNDWTAPQVSLQAPAPGSLVRGVVPLVATASDNAGVSRVDFYDGDTLLGSDTTAPYTWDWDTVATAGGVHTLRAEAYDAVLNQGISTAVTVTVDNAPPTTALSAPGDGATVRNTVTLSVTVLDDVGVARVEFFADGILLGSDSTAPYAWTWDSGSVANGAHVLSARAHDTAGNEGAAVSVSVTVDNDVTAPQVSIAAPLAGASLRGNVSVTASASDAVGVTRLELYAGTRLVGTALNATTLSAWWTTTLETNGPHTLRVLAYDARNNVGEATVVVTVDNEAVPPTIAFASPLDGGTVSGTVRLTVSASDNSAVATVFYEVDGRGIGQASKPPFLVGWSTKLVADGWHTVTATAFDSSGNPSEPATLTVFVANGGAASQPPRAGSDVR
jgi:N-acetylneuraminic acid mutarotase